MYDTDFLIDAYELADEIKNTTAYRDVQKAYQSLLTNEDTVRFIEAFDKAKLLYEEALPMKKFHPDFKSIAARFIEAKTDLYSNPYYITYQNSLQALNQILDEYSKQLNELLSNCYIEPMHSCKKV